ncbi:MAG: Crp/Fnr family transcriptional regulator [Rhodoferax sp.]|nr:Crp/Fnr family transcriptional regulator [Rhodoferax sp.]MCB2039675.1 Crp/Fnr family transcriptional regulator [Rhodoferax sp.]
MLTPRQQAALTQAFSLSLQHGVPVDVTRLFTTRTLRRGQCVLRQGDIWDTATVIHSGLLRMVFTRRDGREFNKSFHREAMLVCPITDAMAQQPSLFSIIAVEPCVLLQAPAARLRAALAACDAWEPLRSALLERLLTRKLEREYNLLAMDGRSRYAHFRRTEPELAARVPLAQLATYLGITDVSLSRIRRDEKKRRD